MTIKRMVNDFQEIYITLIFVYVYFMFYFRDIYVYHLLFFHLLIIVYIANNYKILLRLYHKLEETRRVIHIAFMLWYLCGCLALITIIFNNTCDLSYFYTYFKTPRLILCSLFLIIIVHKKYFGENLLLKFFNFFINACLLYVCITITMIVFPEFKELWFGLIQQTDTAELASQQVLESGWLVSRCGLRGFSGLDCGLYCSFSIMFLIYIFNNFSNRKIHFFIYIKLIVLLIGNICYSRISLMVSFIVILIFLIYVIKKDLRCFFNMMNGIIFFILAFIIFTQYVEGIDGWLDWSMAPLINMGNYFFSNTNQFSLGASGDELIASYSEVYFDDGFFSFFIGVGRYVDYLDIGYLKSFFFYGIIGTVMYYSIFIVLILGMVQYCEKRKNMFGKVFLSMLLVTCFFMECKGEAIHYYLGMFVVFCLLESSEVETKI